MRTASDKETEMGVRLTLPAREPWHGLAREYYFSPELYGQELTRIWYGCWTFACPACEIPKAGDYATLSIGDASVLVLRGNDGSVRAFHNICPHRGTLLCDDATGHVGKFLVCPYHQWMFTRDGAAHRCRDMGEDEIAGVGGLRPVFALEVGGLIFVSLADQPPEAAFMRKHLTAADSHGLQRAKVAHAIDYSVAANWKIVWENNRECYHCDLGHPQYVRSNFDSAEGERNTAERRAECERIVAEAEEFWSAEGLSVKHTGGGLARFPDPADPNPFPVSATRTVMVDGYESESMDGKRVAPLMGALRSHRAGVLRLRSVPSFWAHASCDHAVLTRVLPAGLGHTRIRVTWLVDADAQEGRDYRLETLLPFWQMTSEQDWGLCARVARGVASPAFRPGPLSRQREYNLESFYLWYLKRLA
jgi:Rieske 2Fe-2S family protein